MDVGAISIHTAMHTIAEWRNEKQVDEIMDGAKLLRDVRSPSIVDRISSSHNSIREIVTRVHSMLAQ